MLERHRFFGTRRHGVIWGEGGMRWRPAGAAAQGFKVDRSVFDVEMRNLAESQGATIVRGKVTPGALAAGVPGTARIELDSGGREIVTARVMAVAAGKAAVPRLLEVEPQVQLPETIVLNAVTSARNRLADATVIEGVPEGWWWWLPLFGDRISVSLFADLREVRERGHRVVWRDAVRHARGPVHGLEIDSSGVMSATPRLQRAIEDAVLVGDAAATLDPLSSQGLEKAFASAEEAAYVLNTLLERPDRKQELLSHQRTWERDLFETHAHRTAELYARETRFGERSFWRRRSIDRLAPPPVPEALPERLWRSPDAKAFPIFRRQGRLLQESSGYRLGMGAPARASIGEVPIQALMDLLDVERDTEELFFLASRHSQLFPLARAEMENALKELLRFDLLRGSGYESCTGATDSQP
jgi:flavin-dependent dehydrogenase